MRLRTRVSLLYWVPVGLLFLAGYVLDRRATTTRAVHAETVADDLGNRLSALEKSVFELRELLQDEKKQSNSLVSNDLLHSGRIRDETNIPKPRILGSGRSGRFIYVDVCLPSGSVLRYFLRDGSPAQVKWFVARLRDDVLADRPFVEKNSLDFNSGI